MFTITAHNANVEIIFPIWIVNRQVNGIAWKKNNLSNVTSFN